MPQIVQLEKSKVRGPDPTGFIRTETAEDIMRSLELVRSISGPAITMIAGAPGIGKTETLRHYHRELGQGAVYLSIAKGEGNISHVATMLLRQFNCHRKDGNDATSLRLQIGPYIGADRFLLIDEAQNLHQRHKSSGIKGESFGWLVAASESFGFDLAFCGDLTLPSILSEFPNIQSRVRRPCVIKGASSTDVAALASADDIEGQAEVALLMAVAALPGGLRNVDNVIRMAAIFAGRDRITGLHLKGAILDLKLQPRGGR